MATSRPRRVKFTLLPIAEHRQSKVWDSSTVMVLQDHDRQSAAADDRADGAEGLAPRRRVSQLKGVVRSLGRLKDAFVELAVSDLNSSGRSNSTASCCAMGVVMGPVDFSAYGALTSSVLARKSKVLW